MDEVFDDIVHRNFRTFDIDPDFLVFHKNDLYDADMTSINLNNEDDLEKSRKKKHGKLSEQYLKNLEGTKDSYSDSDETSSVDQNKRRKNRQF